MHIALATAVVVTAFLHVWWLDNLVDHEVFGVWFLVLAVATLVIASRRWVWLPWRAHRRSYVLEEVRPEAGDAVTLVMHAHGHDGRPFAAGQFAWLKIGSSSFVFEEHRFTISSTAEQPHRKTFTIKALGDFSELLRGLRPGRRVFLDGPYGGFTMVWPRPVGGIRPDRRRRRDHADAEHAAHPQRPRRPTPPPPAGRGPDRGRAHAAGGDRPAP